MSQTAHYLRVSLSAIGCLALLHAIRSAKPRRTVQQPSTIARIVAADPHDFLNYLELPSIFCRNRL